jgi:hypothetical protein
MLRGIIPPIVLRKDTVIRGSASIWVMIFIEEKSLKYDSTKN